jgi:acyl dehydratase
MTKLKVGSATELAGVNGNKVAASDWLTGTRKMLDDFADATHDHQWILVDPARAAHDSTFLRNALLRNG